MFTSAIKEIKKAIKSGQSVTVSQMVGAGRIGMGLTDEIYIDGKLACIVSKELAPWFFSESKKLKLNLSKITKLSSCLIK